MRTDRRTSLLTCVAATIAALAAIPAAACAGSVSSKGDLIEINASKGDNKLLIGKADGQIRIEEGDPDNSLRTKGSKCSKEKLAGDRARVVCPADGISEISVTTRGGNDWVVVGHEMPEFRGDRNHCGGSELGVAFTLKAGAGNDIAELGDGRDDMRGGSGGDLLMGCAGDDRIAGGSDGDDVSGDQGNDELEGQSGNDTVVGCSYDPDDVNYPRDEGGDDNLLGGEGEDFLYGCNGRDAYAAGEGEDYLNTRDEVDEVADCGEGPDVIYLDPVDSSPGCEVITNCTTDNFPIGPDTGLPECFARRAAAP